MNILFIDTTTKDAKLSIEKGEQYFENVISDQLQHSKVILTQLEDLLEKASLEIEDIEYVSTNIGPGSFTGIRIGVVTAKGLSYALGTKLVSVDSFLATAENAREFLPCGILIEERKKSGYFSIARDNFGEIEISNEGYYSFDEIEKLMKKNQIERIFSNFENDVNVPVLGSMKGLQEVTKRKIQMGDMVQVNILEPKYIKKSQAEEQRDEMEKKVKVCEV